MSSLIPYFTRKAYKNKKEVNTYDQYFSGIIIKRSTLQTFLKYFSSSLHKEQFFNFIEKKSQEGTYDF